MHVTTATTLQDPMLLHMTSASLVVVVAGASINIVGGTFALNPYQWPVTIVVDHRCGSAGLTAG